MRKSILIALGVSIFLTSVARAQEQERGPKVGDYAPDVEGKEWILLQPGDEVPSLVELRGLVVVLMFWVSWHDGGENVLPYVNMVANTDSVGTAGGVYIIGATDADRKTTEPLVRGAKAFFPVACGSKAAEQYGFDRGWGLVIIDTEGKIAFKGQPENLDGWVDKVREIQRSQPATRTHPTEARRIVQQIESAKQMIAQRNYRGAQKALGDSLSRVVLGDKLANEVMSLIDLCDLLGYEKIRTADRLLDEKKYKEASDALRFVFRRFRGFDVAKDARIRIERFSKEFDAFKEAVSRYGDEDVAYKLLIAARDAVKNQNIGEAWAKLNEIVTKYSSTESAEHAEGMLARMKNMPEVWAYVYDYQARSVCEPLLAQARSLISAKRTKEARDLLQRVMNEYPNSIYAEQAKQETIKLRG